MKEVHAAIQNLVEVVRESRQGEIDRLIKFNKTLGEANDKLKAENQALVSKIEELRREDVV
jgi:cell division protein FtsB